jgi:hypothetical protein
MLDIWVERSIYAKEFIDALKAQLAKSANGNNTTAHSTAPVLYLILI